MKAPENSKPRSKRLSKPSWPNSATPPTPTTPPLPPPPALPLPPSLLPPLKHLGTGRRRFLEALAPQRRWTPAEWAENCRVLGPDETSEPGPYSFDRTPYWKFVLNLMTRPGIEEIIVCKGAQIGWSELCRNALGFWIDSDPGPTLVLMPDQNSTNAFRDERLEPLFKNTPAVGRHLSVRAWDATKYRVKFDTMSLFLTWAGSKSGTKSRPIRYLVCEEPDEYPPFSSTGGDPLAKAFKRITTYSDKGKARVLIGGTPTTRAGNIWKRWELSAVRYHLWVPCPACNGYQELIWKQVKWAEFKDVPERAKRAEMIRSGTGGGGAGGSGGGAWYECVHCQARLRDHQKPRMLLRGIWATEDQVVTLDGRVVGPTPRAKRVAVFVPSYYSPWVRFADLAAEWLEAQDDPQALCDFINQRLAEPFEEQREKIAPGTIETKATGAPPPLLVPAWASALIATADTQGNNDADGYFYYTIRAWGYAYRSQLVDFGICNSVAELRQRCLERQIPREVGGAVAPQLLLVDSGGPRWNEIYQFALSDARIKPTKGMSTRGTWMVNEKLQKRHGLVLWEIDTNQSKDQLHRLITDPDRTRWMVHNQITPDYCRQMGAEAKIYNPNTRREEWVEVVKKNNHYWDCEHQQCAAAWRFGCGAPEPKPVETPRAEAAGQDRPEWMPERPQQWT